MKKFILLLITLFLGVGCASAPEVNFDAELGKALDAHDQGFDTCYKKFGANKNVKTQVKYMLNFSGEIQFSEVNLAETENSSSDMNACVLKEFNSVKLPEVQGHDGVRGVYTLNFKSHSRL